MKTVSLIIIVMYLLLPLACVAHPCDSSLGTTDTVDTSGKHGSPSHHQDGDSCDSSVCCAEYVILNSDITVIYAPLVSKLVTPEQYQKLPKVVIPIFIPPPSPA